MAVEDSIAGGNLPELTVSELAGAIKRTVEDSFGQVRLRGEISGFRGPHSSGHCYFSVKDEKARIDAVIWRGVYQKLRIKPEEGLEVVATGRITTYPGRSVYQIVIEAIEPAGVGALMALLEERRRKLAGEGLFDEARKMALPYLPRVIGVVTSPTGAVIRDILHRLEDRFPVRVLVWPVRVQGETSGSEVAAAIAGFNTFGDDDQLPRPDLIIVARGGGSLEDLWGFNDEAVVRAVAASDIALISAVGHETDWTLIDHASDRRAPTPTAAAEFAVPVRGDLMVALVDHGQRMVRALRRLVAESRSRLVAAGRALPRREALLDIQRQQVDRLADGLRRWREVTLRHYRERLGSLSPRLSNRALRRRIGMERERLSALEERAAQALRRSQGERARRYSAIAPRLDPAQARLVRERAASFQGLAKLLGSLGYESVLARGYAIVHDSDGRLVRETARAKAARDVTITFADGAVAATIDGVEQPGTTARKTREKGGGGGQGTLF